MSTTAVPVPAPTGIHQSWYSKATTWFLHAAQIVKGVVLKIAGEMPAVQAELVKVAPTVEAISEMLLPGSATFEAHLLQVYGVVAKSVNDLGAATASNGIVVNLDQALVDDIKTFLPQILKYMHPAASATPAAPASATIAPAV
jgi:hypothetical protein